jgi:hypothetical protein
LEIRKILKFPRFSDGFLFRISFRKSDQISSKFTSCTLLKWHITLRFSEKNRKTEVSRTFPVTSSRKFSGKWGMRHGQYENTPRITGTGAAQPGFEKKFSRFSENTRTVSREFPWHTVSEKFGRFTPARKNFLGVHLPKVVILS